MKSFTAIILTALLGSAAAAPLEPRVDAQEFDVSELTAGCIPHGTLCTIRFKVATNQMPYATECSFSGTPLGSSSLPDTGFATCTDPSIIWSFRRVQTAGATGPAPFYELALSNAGQNIAAAKFWPASDYPILQSGASFYQQYTGEQRFVIHQ
ncbi:hypothetical protein QBC36DRAFT_222430 [Triangularia setosa]|uniref:Hypersensitive response-inducing protein n=1 Tax=Triangularia setosa TaxID=2587417 RepID=A0AAN7A3D2_9PEZI|nr:hypothetical protein QBC36DRAFT_222430 [Podospora setosa]